MRTFILSIFLSLWFTGIANAQVRETEQNPNYEQSLSNYNEDSVIHELTIRQGTTHQMTYKAIDYRQDVLDMRHERRINRYKFRQERRLERAKNGYYNYGYGFTNSYYRYRPLAWDALLFSTLFW